MRRAKEPPEIVAARRALKNAMLEVRRIQNHEGSGQPVIEANHRLVVPAGRHLDSLLDKPQNAVLPSQT